MENQAIMLDATIIRVHACSSGYKKDSQDQEALGRSKGGFTTKIHTVVYDLGNPLKFILTAGQRNDITQADSLIKSISNTTVVADKGYDANSLIQTIEEQGSTVVIPPKKNRKTQRKYEKHLYKEHHLIECFFSKTKYYRHIFSRFDKTAVAFMGFLNFVGFSYGFVNFLHRTYLNSILNRRDQLLGYCLVK
jgi:transposase